jgi:hypothetical protein
MTKSLWKKTVSSIGPELSSVYRKKGWKNPHDSIYFKIHLFHTRKSVQLARNLISQNVNCLRPNRFDSNGKVGILIFHWLQLLLSGSFCTRKSKTAIIMLNTQPRTSSIKEVIAVFSITTLFVVAAKEYYSPQKIVFHYADGQAIFFYPSQKSTSAMFCLATCTRAFCWPAADSEKGDANNSLYCQDEHGHTFLRTGTHNRYNIRPYPDEKTTAAFNSNTARRLQTGRAYTYRLQRCRGDKVEKRERK